MGAYSNPEIAIDTQSGQHIRDMISSVAGSTISALKTIEANQKAAIEKAEKEDLQIEQDIAKYGTAFDKVGDKIEGANLNPYFYNSSNEVTKTMSKRKNLTGDDRRNNTALYNRQTKSSIDNLTKNFTNIGVVKAVAENVNKNNPGAPGGFYTADDGMNDATRIDRDNEKKMLNIVIGKGYSSNQIEPSPIIDSQTGDFTGVSNKFILKDITGKPVESPDWITSGYLETYAGAYGGGGEYQIPDDKPMLEKARQSTNLLVKTTKDGKISTGSDPDLQSLKLIKGAYTLGAQSSGDQNYVNGVLMEQSSLQTVKLDKKVIAASPDMLDFAGIEMGAMLDTSPMKLAMYYNAVLFKYDPSADKEHMIKDIQSATEVSSKMEHITKAYSNYYVNSLIPKEEYLDKDTNGKPITITKSTKIEEPNAPSESQLTKAAQNKVIIENIDTIETDKTGSIKGTDGKEYTYSKEKGWGYSIDNEGRRPVWVKSNRTHVIKNTKKN